MSDNRLPTVGTDSHIAVSLWNWNEPSICEFRTRVDSDNGFVSFDRKKRYASEQSNAEVSSPQTNHGNCIRDVCSYRIPLSIDIDIDIDNDHTARVFEIDQGSTKNQDFSFPISKSKTNPINGQPQTTVGSVFGSPGASNEVRCSSRILHIAIDTRSATKKGILQR